MTTSPRTGSYGKGREKTHRRLIGLFDSYFYEGWVDLSPRQSDPGRPIPDSAVFRQLLEEWSDNLTSAGLAKETRAAYTRVAYDFLRFAEARGLDSLDQLQATTVLAFLESCRSRWSTNSLATGIGNLRRFLDFVQRQDLLHAVEFAAVRRHYDPVPVLPAGQEQLVIDTCLGGSIPARDAAITLLVLATGLRACDVIALELADIDWHTLQLKIVQQKTGNPLTLPLPRVVASKISEYLLEQRPDTQDRHLFLRHIAPVQAFTDHASIYGVIRSVFAAAGAKPALVGTRLLRHNAATNLLRSGSPLPTISAILGHADPASTDVYLSTDMKMLGACVLPLPPSSPEVQQP